MTEDRREQQKLWLILFQIRAIRTRLNLLVVQYWLCASLAIVIGAAAAVVIAATLLTPLLFVAAAVMIALTAGGALARIASVALRRRANPSRAASAADARAGMKGRLATVFAMAKSPPNSSLWPYLIEDTYGRREDFEPGRIEPRWFSRAILVLAAAVLLFMLTPTALHWHSRSRAMATNGAPAAVTADLSNLEISPADPALKPNARVYADPATLQQLAAKLAQAGKNPPGQSKFSRWMDKARTLANNLQDQVTRQHALMMPPLELRLTNKNPGQHSAQPTSPGGKPLNGSPPQVASGADTGKAPPSAIPPHAAGQTNQLARNTPGLPSPAEGQPLPKPDKTAPLESVDNGAAGSKHGGGSDPDHLFGPPSAQQLGSDSFKITLDAEPSDEASARGAPAYIPPSVRVPLNAEQAPDEPLARAEVPPSDQATIKRVFER